MFSLFCTFSFSFSLLSLLLSPLFSLFWSPESWVNGSGLSLLVSFPATLPPFGNRNWINLARLNRIVVQRHHWLRVPRVVVQCHHSFGELVESSDELHHHPPVCLFSLRYLFLLSLFSLSSLIDHDPANPTPDTPSELHQPPPNIIPVTSRIPDHMLELLAMGWYCSATPLSAVGSAEESSVS